MRLFKWMQNLSRYENMAYVAMWGLLFSAPLLSLWVRTANDSNIQFDWTEVWIVWRQFGVYLLLFLIHNFILAPLLIHSHKRVLYAVLTLCIIVGFTFYQCSSRPMGMKDGGPRHEMMGWHDGPRHFEDDAHKPDGTHRPPEFDERQHDNRHDGRQHDDRHDGSQFDGYKPDKKPPLKPEEMPFVFTSGRDIISIVILILMCGMNLGVKLYFKTRGDQKKLTILEKQNLEQQLEYLKYQINPHFFMNTLNNIHALVDIDPEKSKDTILELSKMMRFVLYEGDKHGVPLTKEFDFIRHYVTLMSLRYTDKVDIQVELPSETPDGQIPPLMLITFIENAFKHGISYQQQSFIHVKVAIEKDQLRFVCRNSKGIQPIGNNTPRQGGVGLANVKKRLHLLYDDNYTLNIQDEADIYNVELRIPITT